MRRGAREQTKAPIHWGGDRLRRQLPVIVADWTNAGFLIALEDVRNFAIINKVKPVTVEVGEIDIGLKWFKWEHKLMMKLDNMRSADGIQSC